MSYNNVVKHNSIYKSFSLGFLTDQEYSNAS